MSWKISQKSHFGGRGAKWVRVEGELYQKLLERIEELQDFDFSNLLEHFNTAGFGWVRYSKPWGTEAQQQAAFEIRWAGSKVDCPKTLFIISSEDATNLSRLGATPFKLGLEGQGNGNVKAPKKAIPKEARVQKMVAFGPAAEKAVNARPSSSKETTKKTQEMDFDALCKELGI